MLIQKIRFDIWIEEGEAKVLVCFAQEGCVEWNEGNISPWTSFPWFCEGFIAHWRDDNGKKNLSRLGQSKYKHPNEKVYIIIEERLAFYNQETKKREGPDLSAFFKF